MVIDEMICAFNRVGFLKLDEIYSQEVPRGVQSTDIATKFTVFKVQVNSESFPHFKFKDEILIEGFQNEFCFTSNVNNADLEWYMSYIKSGTDDYSRNMKVKLGII